MFIAPYVRVRHFHREYVADLPLAMSYSTFTHISLKHNCLFLRHRKQLFV